MRAAPRAFLATGLALLGGCPDRTISAVPVAQGHVEVLNFPANPRRDLDLLFLIDNSGSMKQEQDSLKANFSRFMDVLQSVQGGLPNVHIGVVTSDMGTQTLDGTNAGAAFGCTPTGDNGVLRPLLNGQRYISDTANADGTRATNYTGTLADAFGEMANVGIKGCGIEQHLGAVARALDPATLENQGFVRADAYLAVVVIADEDDCSLAHAGLFATSATNGDAVNFACTEDGVACDSPSTDFLQATGARQDCHPNAGARFTSDVTKYADQIKRLKPDPMRDVIVAGILGPTDNFAITKSTAGTTILDHSCTYGAVPDLQTAFPAIRTAAFLEEFPGRFTQQRICDPDLSPALIAISRTIIDALGSRCFDAPLVNFASDPATDPPLYSCSVVETKEVPNEPAQELEVFGQCDTATATAGQPCWKIVTDPVCSTNNAGNLALEIDWMGAPHDDTIHIEANCVTQSADDGSGSGTQF